MAQTSDSPDAPSSVLGGSDHEISQAATAYFGNLLKDICVMLNHAHTRGIPIPDELRSDLTKLLGNRRGRQ